MGYTPRKTVYRLVREQLHLNKAKLWRSKFPDLDQQKSCLAYQPFVSCRFYWLCATGQNIRYSGVNCALRPSKSVRYSGVHYSRVCFHIFYCNFAGLSNVVHYNSVFIMAGFIVAGCHCKKMLYCACWVPFKLIFLSSGVGKVILQLRNKGYKKTKRMDTAAYPFL